MGVSLTTAVRRAYRATPRYQFDRLVRDVVRWQRRETIARNKLRAARDRLTRYCGELVEEKMK